MIKKIILIIIDGLGDEKIPELGNKTPLDSAATPNLDKLAEIGECGLIKPFTFSFEKLPTSESTHVSMFGYKDYFLKRGPYEVAGIGMKIKKGDIALRVNFGSVDSNLNIIDRRAGRFDKTEDLIKTISGKKINGIKFLVKKSYGHRAGLVIRGEGLSSEITGNDPKEKAKVKTVLAENKSSEAIFTADVLNKFLSECYKILDRHPVNVKRKKRGLLPANYLLVRGAGEFKENPSFFEKYGMKACCIAGGSLYKGIAKILGMDLINLKGATGLPNTDLKAKFKAAARKIKSYDFIFCHIKAVDNFAEDGDFFGKKRFIEKIDKEIGFLVKEIVKLKNQPVLLAVTGDHSTCSTKKRHCKNLIPVVFFLNNKASIYSKIKSFSEKECKKGKAGIINQEELMEILVNF